MIKEAIKAEDHYNDNNDNQGCEEFAFAFDNMQTTNVFSTSDIRQMF